MFFAHNLNARRPYTAGYHTVVFSRIKQFKKFSAQTHTCKSVSLSCNVITVTSDGLSQSDGYAASNEVRQMRACSSLGVRIRDDPCAEPCKCSKTQTSHVVKENVVCWTIVVIIPRIIAYIAAAEFWGTAIELNLFQLPPIKNGISSKGVGYLNYQNDLDA